MEKSYSPFVGKKILCVPLILLLIVSIAAMLTPSVNAPVDLTPKPAMWVSPAEYNATVLGETFVIDVMVDDIPRPGTETTYNGTTYAGVSGITFRLDYDKDYLDVLSISADPDGWAAGFATAILPIYEGDQNPAGEAGWTGAGWGILVPKNASEYAWTMTPERVATITFNVTQDSVYPTELTCALDMHTVLMTDAATVDVIIHDETDGEYNFVPPPPLPPIAAFTWTPLTPKENETVTFDATASEADGGRICTYQWDFGDTTELNTTTPYPVEHNYTVADTYNVTLTVYDSDLDGFGKNLTDTTWELVEVFPPLRPLVCVSPNLVGAEVGKNVTINIDVINATNLWGFEFRLDYDTTLLDGLEVLEGPFLKTGGTTIVPKLEINDLAGYVWVSVALYGAPKGVDGNGTLATVTFKVKVSGRGDWSVLDLRNPFDDPYILFTEVDSGVADYLPHDTEDGYFGWSEVVDLGELGSFPVIMASNSTTSAFAFSLENKEITFNATGPEGTTGFCKVAIPKGLLRANKTHWWKVLLNDLIITDQTTITEDDTHTFIYFTYTHTAIGQEVTAIGTWVVPEFPTALILPLLMIATLAAAILGKITWSKKRRLPIATSKQPA